MSTIVSSPTPNLLSNPPKGRLDRVGMVLSSACAVHCLAMPFVVGTLAYFGQDWVASESTELLLVGSAFLVALGSLLPSYRQHRNPIAIILFALGLLLIAGVHYAGLEHGVAMGATMAVGGSLIALAHWRNHKLCACCQTHAH